MFRKKQPTPLTDQAGNRQIPNWFFPIFFSVFGVAGLAVLLFVSLPMFLEQWSMSDWVETECLILTSEVERRSTSDGTTFSPKITYSYRFEGREYESDRYRIMNVSSSSSGYARGIVERFPAGTESICHVNPDDPSKAVLDTSWGLESLFIFFPLPFLAVGVGGWIYWWRKYRRQPSPLKIATTPQQTWLPDSAAVGMGTMELKPTQTPMGKFLTFVFIGLIWNGGVSVFLVSIVNGFRRGEPDWFLTLFMIPFVVVGLILLLAALYQFLALFNAKTRLWIDNAPARLGSSLRLRWQINGRTDNIQAFRILLEGEEVSIYRRGTRTVTDRQRFAEFELIRVENRLELFSGSVDFLIPVETMHTLMGCSNKIEWHVELRGKIPRWPDLSVKYPLVILPIEVGSRPSA